MAAPSPITKPSRPLSNGRDAFSGSLLRVDIARTTLKDPKQSGAMGVSTPPANITAAAPSWIKRQASPMAIVPAAQLLEFAVFGPVIPNSMAILHEAAPPNTVTASRG